MDVKNTIENFKFVDPNNMEYLNKFKEILVKNKGNGWEYLPSEIIRPWFAMNKMISLGYDEDIYELKNDISCRRDLELLLNDEELNKFSEHQYFKDKVIELDNVFKEMSFEYEPFKGGYYSNGIYYERNWWEARILKYASYEYVLGLAGLNIEIELKEGAAKEPNSDPFYYIRSSKKILVI